MNTPPSKIILNQPTRSISTMVCLALAFFLGLGTLCSAQDKKTPRKKKRAAPISHAASALTGKKADELRVNMDAVVKGFDFVPFFKGEKLEGINTTGNWILQPDGNELQLQPREGEEGWKRYSAYLWSDQAYSDFVIDFEFKFEPGGNSGFYFRVADLDDPVAKGCELQLNDTHSKGAGINHHDIGGLLKAHPAAVNAGANAGEWCRVIVHIEGNRFRAYMNGFQIHDIDLGKTPLKDRPAKGFIGFQDHGENFWLRNARIAVPVLTNKKQGAAVPARAPASSPSPSKGVEGITLSDPNLQVELIDTDAAAFFLSHDMDLQGRLYTGSREAVFLYDRKADGRFKARKELFRFPANTWIYDLEAFGDDLLVLCNTALFRLRDVHGADPSLEKILWGNPLGHHHQGLHGIEFAPDGDLLICLGDPHPGVHLNKARPDHLWHWTWYVGPKNRPVLYSGVGAVMRLDLDNCDLSVYASGLRNPCGISFDRDWHLFSNDNDQEGSTSAPCRLVAVPQHSWNGWARGWDLRKQNPARLDLIPNVNWELDVPVGQGYYDHPAFGEDYRGSLFVANWGNRSVSRHPIQVEGAGFRAKSLPFLRADGIRRPVSALPTNDGGLIVSLCYMTGNQPSPQCQTDLVLVSPRKTNGDATFNYADQPLVSLLSEPVQIRAKAHREILRQGGAALEAAAKAFLEAAPAAPDFSSLIFLAAAQGDAASIKRITELAQGDGRAATLAWRAAAAFHATFAGLNEAAILKAAAKTNQPKLLCGLLEFHYASRRPISDPVARLAAHADPTVRQSAAILLARQAPDKQLATLAIGTPDQRLASTLATAFRLWAAGETIRELPEGSAVALEKHMKLTHPEGSIDLRDLGKPVGTYMLSNWWKDPEVKKANQASFNRLQQALTDKDKEVAIAAATGLFFLNDPAVDEAADAILYKNGIILSMIKGKANKADLDKALAALKDAKLSSGTAIPEAFREIDWDSKTAPKGDVVVGKVLFTERGCIACHLAPHDGAGGSIGPSLVGVGKRFPPSYLAASMLVPNLTVSPNFHPNTITLKDGTIHTGYVEPGGAPGFTTLRIITGQVMEIPKDQVAKQNASEQSMMPAGLIATPKEMHDMIAYLKAPLESKKKKRNKKK